MQQRSIELPIGAEPALCWYDRDTEEVVVRFYGLDTPYEFRQERPEEFESDRVHKNVGPYEWRQTMGEEFIGGLDAIDRCNFFAPLNMLAECHEMAENAWIHAHVIGKKKLPEKNLARAAVLLRHLESLVDDGVDIDEAIALVRAAKEEKG